MRTGKPEFLSGLALCLGHVSVQPKKCFLSFSCTTVLLLLPLALPLVLVETSGLPVPLLLVGLICSAALASGLTPSATTGTAAISGSFLHLALLVLLLLLSLSTNTGAG